MANNIKLRIRALIASAGRVGSTIGKNAQGVLEAIADGITQGDVTNGKVLIGNTESGGSVTFAIPEGHTPLEMLDLVQAALESPAIAGSSARRKITHLKASFAKANP